MTASRAILVHGWEGNPQNCWFPWLSRELTTRGWRVEAPAMPDPSHPRIGPWVDALRQTIRDPDPGLVLIGHSIGCQAILRAAQTYDEPLGGALLVAGFFHLRGLSSESEREEARPWEEEPLADMQIRDVLPKIHVLLSDDDAFVDPTVNGPLFATRLGAAVTVLPAHAHFDDAHGWRELPEALAAMATFSA